GSADALAAGLVDRVTDEDVVEAAIRFAQQIVASGAPAPRTSERTGTLGTPAENAPRFDAARALAARIRRHQTAPLRAIAAIDAATTLPFDEGCRRERALFFECIAGDQAKAMIHVFFAERAAAKAPALSPGVTPAPLSRVASAGAGTMGGGIAMVCANAGL